MNDHFKGKFVFYPIGVWFPSRKVEPKMSYGHQPIGWRDGSDSKGSLLFLNSDPICPGEEAIIEFLVACPQTFAPPIGIGDILMVGSTTSQFGELIVEEELGKWPEDKDWRKPVEDKDKYRKFFLGLSKPPEKPD